MIKHCTLFKALSDPTRLRIMLMLIRAKKELCICELMDTLTLAQYHISRHIKELKNAGLVRERKEGRFVFYACTRPVDAAHRFILNALGSMEDDVVRNDARRLNKRLALRKNGKCVVGIMKGGSRRLKAGSVRDRGN